MTTAIENIQRTKAEEAALLYRMLVKKDQDLVLYYHFESLREELNLIHDQKQGKF